MTDLNLQIYLNRFFSKRDNEDYFIFWKTYGKENKGSSCIEAVFTMSCVGEVAFV